MEFTQSSDHEAIREGIRKICAGFDDDYWSQQDEAHEFPWEFYNRLAEGGWVGIAIPEEYGGGGQGITEASVMLEEIAASEAAMNGCSPIHLSIFGMEPVRRYGSPELAAEVLPRVATGELHVAFGVTEPDAGTDTTAITRTAVRDGDEYVVTGAKVWTTKAPYCELCLLLVRTTPRGVCAPDRRDDVAPRRPATPRSRHPSDPEARPQAVVSVRSATTVCGCPSAGGSAKRAKGSSPTCSTGSTRSGSSSRQKRSAPARSRSSER